MGDLVYGVYAYLVGNLFSISISYDARVKLIWFGSSSSLLIFQIKSKIYKNAILVILLKIDPSDAFLIFEDQILFSQDSQGNFLRWFASQKNLRPDTKIKLFELGTKYPFKTLVKSMK